MERSAMRQIWITKAGPPEVLQTQGSAGSGTESRRSPHPGRGERRSTSPTFWVGLGCIRTCRQFRSCRVTRSAAASTRSAHGVDARLVGTRRLRADALRRLCGRDLRSPWTHVFERPGGMSAGEGAAIPVNYFTAWQLMRRHGRAKSGETVLVHSVGGGVGIAATQIAKHIGATVIGTASAGKARRNARVWRRSSDRLPDRGFRSAHPRDHQGPGRRAHSRCRRRQILEEGLSHSCTDGTARDVRDFRGGQGKERNILG